MYLKIGPGNSIGLKDIANFTEFHAVVPTGTPSSEVQRLLEESGAGRLEDNHVWVARQFIEDAGKNEGDSWDADLARMVRFARSRGWTDRERRAIRAHIVASDDAAG